MMIAPLVVALLAAPSAASAPSVGTIRMQLFYEDSGRLSRDIAPPADFTGWNTIIGEGSAEEAANDLLVLVEVRGAAGENIAQPLSVVARGGKGKVIGQRRFTSLLTSGKGRTWKALWLTDVGCAGRIEVTATIGRSTRKSAIDLDCGE
ncbi:MAG TPA: hypothetical protein VK403_08835 [Allosphingosinicella sp.]|nr:hypothetical protein [Allosphingosinicella sp.]